MTHPRGIDVSHHQGTIDWRKVAASGVVFAFIKSTQGDYFTDPYFHRNRQAAKDAGILVGAYHYYDPNIEAAKQAKHFREVVGPVPAGELQPMLDVEESRGKTPMFLVAHIAAVLADMEALTSRHWGIYTYPDWWRRRVKNSEQFAMKQPLWIANYDVQTPTTLSWPFWSFWQDSSSGQVPGVAGRCDTDLFNGSMVALRRFAGL